MTIRHNCARTGLLMGALLSIPANGFAQAPAPAAQPPAPPAAGPAQSSSPAGAGQPSPTGAAQPSAPAGAAQSTGAASSAASSGATSSGAVKAGSEAAPAAAGAPASSDLSELRKDVDELQDESVRRSDVEALRDVLQEHVLRSVGSTSSISPYTIDGNIHLVSLSAWASVGYTGTFGNHQTTTRSFRVPTLSATLSGILRNNGGAEGDVKYNISVLGQPYKYNAAKVDSQSTSSATSSSINSSTYNGLFLGASDVWASIDIKTNKLELEPAWTLSLQAGQSLTQYGIEPTSTENNRPTINQAQFISRLGFGRDIGVTASGGFIHRNDPSSTTVPLVGYVAGLYNGAGANSFDTNTGFDLLGRLTLNPFYKFADNFRNLTFGVNWYEGNVGSSTGDLPTKRRYGADISWLRKPFLLTGEVILSKDGYDGRKAPVGTTGPTPTAAFAESTTYLATLFWTPSTLADFQPWIRYDRFEPTAFSDLSAADLATANANGTGNNARDAYSGGFNWYIWSAEPVTRRSYSTAQTTRVLKFQSSYTYYRQEAYTGAKHQVDFLLIGTL